MLLMPCRLANGFRLVVRLSDNTLEVFVDGKSVLSHEHNGPLPGGNGVGLRPGSSEVRYRKLWVTQATDAGSDPKTTSLPFPKSSGDVTRSAACGAPYGAVGRKDA